MADEVEPTEEQLEKIRKIDAWLRTLLNRSGIQTINMSHGDAPPAFGLLNVPAKYVGIIDAMHIAMVHLSTGQELPEFVPVPLTSEKRTKNRRRHGPDCECAPCKDAYGT